MKKYRIGYILQRWYNLIIIALFALVVACTKGNSYAPKSIIANIPKELPELPTEVNFVPENFRYTVDVYYKNDTVLLSDLPHGVTASVSGANVSISSLADSVEYLLHGAADSASFTLQSEKSPLITLMHLRLFSRDRAAIDVTSPEIAYIQSVGNSINYIMDGVPGDTSAVVKKASALSVHGSAVLCGNGKLAMRGERKAAMRATGTLVVDGVNLSIEMARADGVVADSGLVIKSGNMQISSWKDAIKSKAGSVVLLGGNMVLNGIGKKGDAVQARNIIMYNGHLSAKIVGEASRGLNSKGSIFILGGILDVEASGSAIYSAKKNDYTSGACIKTENHFYMGGGYVSLNNSGVAGKGVNCNGQLQIDAGTLLVCNRGNDVVHELDPNAHASAKGIKCDSTMLINGGTIEVLVFGQGERCEGIESKYDMTIGGNTTDIYVYANDDAINSGGNFVMNGGRVYAYSVSNDAVDSNDGIALNDGLLIANGSNSPEQGIDTDFENRYSITGGTVLSIGGTMGPSPCLPKSSATSQPVVAWGGTNLQRNKFVMLSDSDGKVVMAYEIPRNLQHGGVLFSAPELKIDEAYSLAIVDSVSDDMKPLGYGLYKDGRFSGGSNVDWTQTAMLVVVGTDGKTTAINPDTLKMNDVAMMPPPMPPHNGAMPPMPPGFHPQGGMMPPPPPGGFPPHMMPEMPDSIKEHFMKRNDEGYSMGNLPGR